MKKSILLLFLTAIFISCSSDDSGSSHTDGNSFNPPSWILGKWTTDENLSLGETGFEFKANDFCYITTGINTCFKSMLDTYSGTDVITKIEEEKSDSHYKVKVTLMSSTYEYHFVKISATEIQEILSDPNGYVAYYSQNHDDDQNVTVPSLPLSLDFKNLTIPNGATSLNIGGIVIKTLGSSTNPCSAVSNNQVIQYHNYTEYDWDVYPANSGIKFHYGYYPNNDYYNYVNMYYGLTFELNLPSVQKVRLKLYNECCATIILCNENGVIIEEVLSFDPQNPERDIVLNVGGQKVDKLIMLQGDSSLEVIYSLDIE